MNPVDAINRIMADLMRGSRKRRKHSYIYWNPPKQWNKTIYLFGYTPHRTVVPTSNGNVEGFFAVKFRKLKNGELKLVKYVRFGRRKIASNRSMAWYKKYYAS